MLVTKVFNITNTNIAAIELAVNAQLKKDRKFLFSTHRCYVHGQVDILAVCFAPEELVKAFNYSYPISFSVSLPARYWR